MIDSERKAYNKSYYKNNLEKIKAYRENNLEKIKASQKVWREKNREKEKASMKSYQENNREKVSAQRKSYYKNNLESLKAYRKSWYRNNLERVKACHKSYYENNLEKINTYKKSWHEEHREKINAQRKSNKKNNPERLKDYFKNKPVSWDDPFSRVKFVNEKFDFTISPDKFIKWLVEIGEEIIGDYKIDVTTMCEHGCFYIAKVLKGKKLKSKLMIHEGKFGFWDHTWISYMKNSQEFYIDLTLQQFLPYAPKLAISKASDNKNAYKPLGEPEDVYEFFKRQVNLD